MGMMDRHFGCDGWHHPCVPNASYKVLRGWGGMCVTSNQTFVLNKTFISWMLIDSDK